MPSVIWLVIELDQAIMVLSLCVKFQDDWTKGFPELVRTNPPPARRGCSHNTPHLKMGVQKLNQFKIYLVSLKKVPLSFIRK